MNNTLLNGLEKLKKQRKDNVSNPKPIENEDIEALFKDTLAKINNVYVEGTLEYVRENYADLNGQLSTMDEKTDSLWESCLNGTSKLNDFRENMNQYEQLYLKAIYLYKNRGDTVQNELNFSNKSQMYMHYVI
jgi:hypothetical protein